jgi:hypothetical protein
MTRIVRAGLLASLVLALLPSTVLGQSFTPVTTRAAGMGGAFVAVVDDASAVYWNPAALASGAFFSLLLDRTSGKATGDLSGGSESATLFALGTPPLGLSYYRLRLSSVRPAASAAVVGGGPASEVTNLVTHHTGITLVHSLSDHISVGTTLKLVRGIATSTLVPGSAVDDLLDQANDLVGEASNRFDADIGVSAVAGNLRAGLTLRNATSPRFDAAGGGDPVRLDRQARAGVSLASPLGFLVAVDADLNAARGPLGRVQEVAAGTEVHLLPRAYVRGGVRLNALGDEPGGHAPGVSLGASYAAMSSLWIDAQATVGSEAAGRGWGVAARVGL